MSPAPLDHFADRAAAAIDALRAPCCVGLDPVVDRLPDSLRPPPGAPPEVCARAIESFCRAIIESVAGVVPIVKPQSACFERYGAPGVAALHAVCRAAKSAGLLVLLDAKRGDIGLTAEHYAAAAFDPVNGAGADALTVNAYLGPDSVAPYLAPPHAGAGAGRGVFVLVRTSNPGSDAIQSQRLADGRTVAEMMADETARLGAAHVGRSGYSLVGAVVAATKPADAAALRRRMPNQLLLVPGFGAQGGTPETVRELFMPNRPAMGGVIITASRSVIYPIVNGKDWKSAVRTAAERFVDEVRRVADPARGAQR